MLKLDKIKWGQKSRQTQIQLWDKNNPYFQTIDLNRRRKNKIWKIRDSEGIWFDDQNGISKVFMNDFTKSFTLEHHRINLEPFDSFSPCMEEEENKELIKVVTEEEIRIDFSQINNLKGPRLNGLQESFYK